MKRHNDAIAIQAGACNPSGIAIAIVEACKEIRESEGFHGTASITTDLAIRLMVHQLAFICGLFCEFVPDSLNGYHDAMEACEESK